MRTIMRQPVKCGRVTEEEAAMRQVWAAVLVVGFVCTAQADDLAPIPIGTQITDLRFKDIRYLSRTLSDLGEADAYVFAFITNTCPLAQRYGAKLVELEAEYGAKKVTFVAVNVGPADTIQDMAWHALQYEMNFPVVKDTTGDVVRALGVKRTPEVVVLDKDKKIRYRGRIDDQYRLGGVRPEVGRHDLREALDDLLAGGDVEVAETVAEGCVITFPEVPAPDREITYHKDIVPIVNTHCLSCHRPDGGAPFSLNSYNKVSGRADMFAEVIDEGRMPPWYAHPDHGEFMNETRLTNEEKLIVKQWITTGKLEGNIEDAPAVPTFTNEEWTINPDLVIKASSPVAVIANGYMPYVYQFLPHKFEEDTYVEAMEIRGTNADVVHHANLVYTLGDYKVDQDSQFLTGMVPGGGPAVVEAGLAWLIPKGASLVLQEHLVTTGKVESNTMMVGLRFAKSEVDKKIYFHNLDVHRFKIPPFARAHRLEKSATLDTDVTGVGLFSHMHLRGRDMTFYARRPGEDREVLLTLPNYNFDWQLAYKYPTGKFTLPAGTVIEAVAHYDNSPWNPYNPAPEKEVKNGAQTVDEMFNGFYIYTRNDEELNLKIDPNTGHVLTELAANN